MTLIPLFPRGRGGLKSGIARGDALFIDRFDGWPVFGLEGADLHKNDLILQVKNFWTQRGEGRGGFRDTGAICIADGLLYKDRI